MENEIITGYRVMEIKKGKILSMYYATNWKRAIPLDIWHKAEIKTVYDTTRKNMIPYISGWHFLKTREDAEMCYYGLFMNKKKKLAVIECRFRGNIRRKENTARWRPSFYLAEEIYIDSESVKSIL